jgi:putative effector of murein hydrolase
MKIFNSFDTKLDEKEFLDAINHYGKGNAILTKKHWIFLLAPLFLLIVTIGAFFLLIWFSYTQYYTTHPFLFRMVGSIQLAVTLIWIIHSIQTISFMIKQHSRI